MSVPFLVFVVLLVIARKDLGIRGICTAIAVWLALLVCFTFAGMPLLFTSAQALLDVFLILKVFGGDINIR